MIHYSLQYCALTCIFWQFTFIHVYMCVWYVPVGSNWLIRDKILLDLRQHLSQHGIPKEFQYDRCLPWLRFSFNFSSIECVLIKNGFCAETNVRRITNIKKPYWNKTTTTTVCMDWMCANACFLIRLTINCVNIQMVHKWHLSMTVGYGNSPYLLWRSLSRSHSNSKKTFKTFNIVVLFQYGLVVLPQESLRFKRTTKHCQRKYHSDEKKKKQLHNLQLNVHVFFYWIKVNLNLIIYNKDMYRCLHFYVYYFFLVCI